MATALLLVCFLFSCCFLKPGWGTVFEIPGRSNKTLEYYLCGSSLSANTTLILESNVSHYITPSLDNSTICLISDTYSITVEAVDTLATVICEGTHLATRRGIAFHNVTNLIVKDVSFVGCGGFLSESVSFLNGNIKVESQFYFPAFQSAALIFDTCSDLKLSGISIIEYQGFGMILLDSYGQISIQNLIINGQTMNNASDVNYGGSGLLVYYRKQLSSSNIPVVVISISNTLIKNGHYNNYGLVDTMKDMVTGIKPPYPYPITGGSGLSVILREAGTNIIKIVMNDVLITNNTALQAGGITMLFIDVENSNITMNNLTADNNCATDPTNYNNAIAESLMVYFFFFDLKTPTLQDNEAFPLIINNGTIGTKDPSLMCQGADNIGSYAEIIIIQAPQASRIFTVKMNKVYFQSKSGSSRGSAIALYASALNKAMSEVGFGIQLIDVTASDFNCTVGASIYSCHNVGVFAFSDLLYAEFVNGTFSNNKGSSVIYSVNSRIALKGYLIFNRNEVQTYGAIRLKDASLLLLYEPLYAIFAYNRGLLGAAINAVTENEWYCALQYYPKNYYDISNYTKMLILLEMVDNKAELAGNALYASPLKFCQLNSRKLDPSIRNLTFLLENTFKLNGSASEATQDISSIATQICNCSHYPGYCTSNYTYILKTAHPGQKLTISVAAFDIGQKVSVYSLVTAQFYSHGILGVTSLRVDPNEVITKISAGKCSLLSYTIYHSINRSEVSYPINNVLLNIGPYTETPRYTINITLTSCPPGFYSANSSCNCVYDDFTDFSCDLQEGIINRPINSWIGHLSNNAEVFGYSSNCPPSYCLTNTAKVSFTDPSRDMCFGNRSGTLCGDCPDGLSVVFGTADCKKCSNAYLATILLFAIAGIGLVFLLFILQLTLTTGTINGLIFYANIVGSTDGYLFGHEAPIKYLRIFISLINLGLGFPLCFYNSMNELIMRCLQFVFPVYLWLIVILIIILSRYSGRLSRITGRQSVQVLATLVYLSYSKIFISIVNILTPATVTTNEIVGENKNKKLLVWFLNGQLEFGKGLHLIPMFLSLTMLCLFIIPFTVLTTLSPYLSRYRIINRFMPLTDAVFAPYKMKWRFWFGARLCLLAAAFISDAVLRGTDVKLSQGIQLVLLLGFSFVQSFFHPFKNKAIGALDLFFMLNYCFVSFFVVYTQGQTNGLRHNSAIFVSAAMIIAICIIVYHCYKSCKMYCRSNKSVLFRGRNINNYGAAGNGDDNHNFNDEQNLPEVHNIYAAYREPLLSSK